jgi:hypothetical protein
MFIPEGEPLRERAGRLHDIRRWSLMPRGGHFAAGEPQLAGHDIAALLATLDRQRIIGRRIVTATAAR